MDGARASEDSANSPASANIRVRDTALSLENAIDASISGGDLRKEAVRESRGYRGESPVGRGTSRCRSLPQPHPELCWADLHFPHGGATLSCEQKQAQLPLATVDRPELREGERVTHSVESSSLPPHGL